jgi:hypothetical protein
MVTLCKKIFQNSMFLFIVVKYLARIRCEFILIARNEYELNELHIREL